jgi:hypothetical protein
MSEWIGRKERKVLKGGKAKRQSSTMGDEATVHNYMGRAITEICLQNSDSVL